ncbi:hypothetical protein [Sphingobium sp.]|uniref:hypothetical protein n=1 Tax=Sphingobium sp. TaxID=1912891 RepID=UPI002E22811B
MRSIPLPDSLVEVTKAVPPVAVTGISLAGIGLSDWVLISTLIYTVMQAGWFVWEKLIRPWRAGRDGR